MQFLKASTDMYIPDQKNIYLIVTEKLHEN